MACGIHMASRQHRELGAMRLVEHGLPLKRLKRHLHCVINASFDRRQITHGCGRVQPLLHLICVEAEREAISDDRAC